MRRPCMCQLDVAKHWNEHALVQALAREFPLPKVGGKGNHSRRSYITDGASE